ncbi:membrane protein, putative [plant metagenome]|uniref:Membrane protein, putative n=1 Tax=plant metagenome TaxID=1297885 RepID=A0A484RYW0_9ZZZZ
MSHAAKPAVFPRHIAIAVLLAVGCTFAGNHVAARIAFDEGTGLLLAVLVRSGTGLLALGAVVLWQRQSLRLPPGTWRWQALLGVLITIQSLCLYSAVARVPVAVALLVANVFPVILALLTWALGGKPPSRRTALIMSITLCGLLLVLDIPAKLAGQAVGPEWIVGIACAVTAACAFASGLWVTEHKLAPLAGATRSFYTILIVFTLMIGAGSAGVLPSGMVTPDSLRGWLGIAALAVLYSAAFSILFVSIPRLDMARNAPVMNIEPVATLFMGWALLGQTLEPIQLVGGAIVLSGIILLAYSKQR